MEWLISGFLDIHLACHEVRLSTFPYYRLAKGNWFHVFHIKTWSTIEKLSFPLNISGWYGRISFMSLKYTPGPAWKTPPSLSILQVGISHLIPDFLNKDLARNRKRPILFHIIGEYDKIGFRSSRYAPDPPWKTPPSSFIIWISKAPASFSIRSWDVFFTFDTIGLQFCFKLRALRNGNTPE